MSTSGWQIGWHVVLMTPSQLAVVGPVRTQVWEVGPVDSYFFAQDNEHFERKKLPSEQFISPFFKVSSSQTGSQSGASVVQLAKPPKPVQVEALSPINRVPAGHENAHVEPILRPSVHFVSPFSGTGAGAQIASQTGEEPDHARPFKLARFVSHVTASAPSNRNPSLHANLHSELRLFSFEHEVDPKRMSDKTAQVASHDVFPLPSHSAEFLPARSQVWAALFVF